MSNSKTPGQNYPFGQPEGKYKYFEEANPGIPPLIPADARVLDVGCGFGALGEVLVQNGAYVVGLDIEPFVIEVASQRMSEAYACDVTSSAPLPVDDGEPFDIILFADVLEHLYDPGAVLMRLKPLLAEDGRIVISVPNVASWPVRLGLLFGRFNYADTGILDYGHVRFFTKKTLRALVESTGFRIERMDVTPNFARACLGFVRKWYLGKSDAPPDPKAIVESGAYRTYIRWVFPVERLVARVWASLFAFQFIVSARPADSMPAKE